MLIIWSGWGVVVPIANVVAFLASGACLSAFAETHPSPIVRMIFIVLDAVCWGGLSALGIYLFAQRMAAQPGRELIDAQTNERVVLKKSAGSFFFIPTQYWTFITLGVWTLGVVIALSGAKV